MSRDEDGEYIRATARAVVARYENERATKALDNLPRDLRLALIAGAIIEDYPGAVTSCAALASLAAIMGAQLNRRQRLDGRRGF